MNPEELAAQGRGGDTELAHVMEGEMMIPPGVLSPELMQAIMAEMEAAGIDPEGHTVGQGMSINPETGLPEFGFGKVFKKVGKLIKKVAASPIAPIALSVLAPGLGTSIGAGLGATGAAASGLGGAVLGGGLGLAGGGGIRGALTGAITGGAGSYLNSGGASNIFGGTRVGNALGLGSTPGTTAFLDKAGASGGLRGSISSLGGSSLSGAGGGSSFSPLGLAANAFGAYSQDDTLKKQQRQLLAANQQQLTNLDSFDPSGITKDPGYQFNLEQGQLGLQRGLGAAGNLQSGRALKAASEYNQQYAQNAFNDYYQRWAQRVGGQNALYGAGGDVRANATGARGQNISQSLSNALGVPVGQYGQGMTLEQLRRLGMAV